MSLCPYCGSPVTDGKACTVCGAVVVTPHLPLGTRLANGRYSLGRVLGQGGFGITYQGADLLLTRPVAIKECFPDGAIRLPTKTLQAPTSFGIKGFREALDGFINEARTLARFNDPGIMRVQDVFEEHGTAYLAMEYLDGETLAARIAREGKLDAATVAAIAQKIARALDQVHAAGVLHRDIKPDNLFCSRDGRMVLIDFGAARGFNREQTVRHTRMVTDGYAPLEQYASQARFGPYTDLYAFAATLYHALSGSPPAGANDRVLGTLLQPLPLAVPAGLREAVTRALALQVAERPQNVAEFLHLLSGAPAGPQPQFPSPTLTAPGPTVPPAPAARGTRFTVVLEDPQRYKTSVTDVIRDLLGYEARVARVLVDQAPSTLATNLSQLDALSLSNRLTKIGARVQIRPTAPNSLPPDPLAPSPPPTAPPIGTNHAILLAAPGQNKSAVARVLHDELGFDLTAGKHLLDAAPVTIAAGLPARSAEAVAAKLRAAGATVRVAAPSGAPLRPAPAPVSEYVVILEHPGPSKIDAIKIIWSVLAITMEQGQSLVDHAPSKLRVPDQALADQLVADLTRVGARVTSRPAR